MYYVGTIDRLLGENVRYGVVFRSTAKAKKELSRQVRLSREEARNRGYGMVYSHWSEDRKMCELTFGKDRRSSRWDLLAVIVCKPGIPYKEVR